MDLDPSKVIKNGKCTQKFIGTKQSKFSDLSRDKKEVNPVSNQSSVISVMDPEAKLEDSEEVTVSRQVGVVVPLSSSTGSK